MVTLAEARESALREIRASYWQHAWGEVLLDDEATYENDEVYTFDYGPREWVVDRDDSKALFGNPLAVVRKADGIASLHPAGPPPLSDFDEKFPNLHPVDK